MVLPICRECHNARDECARVVSRKRPPPTAVPGPGLSAPGAPWRVSLARWAVAALAVGAGIAVGRCTAPEPPARVEVQERVVTREVQATQTQHVEERAAVQVQTRVVYRDRIVTPDGTVREREVERSEAASAEHAQRQTTTAEVRTAEAHRETVRTVTVPAPDWRVSLLVGAPVRLTPGPVLVGGHIQRRLWGPVSAGAWTLIPTGPGAPLTAGASVSVEF